MVKKRALPEDAKFNYLSSIIQSHSIYQNRLTEKTGFVVAVAALLLTVGFTLIVGTDYGNFPFFVQLAIIIPSVGAFLSVIICISTEKTEPIKRSQSFHPLSITEFNDEARSAFKKDIQSVLSDEKEVIVDYSNQILHMKEDIFRRTMRIAWAIRIMVLSMFCATFCACIQLWIYLL